MLRGIDVSHFDPDLDYKRAHAEGAAFIVHKASEGTSTDPAYARRAPAIKASGAVPGAYHFPRSSPSAAAQVDHFLSVIGDPAGMLIQWDWEVSGSDLASISMVRTQIAEWNQRTNNHPVLIYLPHWVWADHLGSPPGLSTLGPLWASHYLTGTALTLADGDRVPASWWAGYGGWQQPTVLQYAGEAGRIAGAGPADLNVFDGSLDDLQALTGGGDMELDGRSREELDQMYAEIAFPYSASGGKVAFGGAFWQLCQDVTSMKSAVATLGTKVDHLSVPPAAQVDVAALAAALRDHLGPDLVAALGAQLTKQ